MECRVHDVCTLSGVDSREGAERPRAEVEDGGPTDLRLVQEVFFQHMLGTPVLVQVMVVTPCVAVADVLA